MTEENNNKLDPTLLKIKNSANDQNASEELEARYESLKSITAELEAQKEVLKEMKKNMSTDAEATIKYGDQLKDINDELKEIKKTKKEITKLQVVENKTAAETLEITDKILENTKIATKLRTREAKDKEKQIKKQTQEEAKSFKQIERHTKKVASSASGIQSVSGLIGAGGAVASSGLDFMGKHAQKYGAKQAAIAKKGGDGATRAKIKSVGAKMATAGLGMFSGLVGGLVKALIFNFEMGVRSKILKNIVATSYGGKYKKATTNVLGSKYLSASETEGAINKYIPTGLKGLNTKNISGGYDKKGKKKPNIHGYAAMTGLERMSGSPEIVQNMAQTLSPLLKGDLPSVVREIGGAFIVMEKTAAETGVSAQMMFKNFAQAAEVASYMNVDLRLVSAFMKETALNADKLGQMGVNVKDSGRMFNELQETGKKDLATVYGMYALAGKGEGDPFKLRSKLLYGKQRHQYTTDSEGRTTITQGKKDVAGTNAGTWDVIDTIQKGVTAMLPANASQEQKDSHAEEYAKKFGYKFDTVKLALALKGPGELTATKIEELKKSMMTPAQQQLAATNRISTVLTTGITMDKHNQVIQQAMADIMLGVFSTLVNIFTIISAGFKAAFGSQKDKDNFNAIIEATAGRTMKGFQALKKYGSAATKDLFTIGDSSNGRGGKGFTHNGIRYDKDGKAYFVDLMAEGFVSTAKEIVSTAKEIVKPIGSVVSSLDKAMFPGYHQINRVKPEHTGSKGQSITNADAMFGETFIPGSGGSKFSIASSKAFKVVSPSSSGGDGGGNSNQTMNFNFNITTDGIITEERFKDGVARSLEAMIKEKIV